MSSSESNSSSGKPRRQHSPNRGAAPRASWFGDLGLVDFQIEFYERILARNPDQVHVLRALGELLPLRGRYARSLEVNRRLVSLVPHDYLAHYNLACSLAMQGAPAQAIQELGRAIAYGYDDFDHLEIDPDLDGLRGLPAYHDLLRLHGIES